MILWSVVFIPTLILVILMGVYLIISVTCRPFWEYKLEIRSVFHYICRKMIVELFLGYSRFYFEMDEIVLESARWSDSRLD